MASKRCMNAKCGNTEPGGEWKQGWGLKSGAFATLCEKCGMAYEQLVFCDMFHQKETGWRNCNICGKYLHCGCVVSKFSFDLLDNGGVQCISCMKNSENRPAQISSDIIKDLLPQPPVMVLSSSTLSSRDEKANDFGMSAAVNAYKQPISTDGKMDNDTICKGKDMWMGKNIESNGESRLVFAQQDRINESFRHIKQEQVAFHVGEVGNTSFTYSNQAALGPSQISKQVDYKDAMSDSGVYESLAEACPSISLGTSNPAGITACFNSKNPPGLLSLSNSSTEGKEQNKVLSTFQQEQRTCHLVPKIPKVSHGPNSEASKDILSRMRVARPPGEGRIRNQLLPRYWPRITDQELQQISGDSNSTIVPLFEKVLSASDAGRIGRLVLPKACAEVAEEIITCAHDGNFFVSCGMSMLAYFPPISQPEGLPLKIQDVKGKDWVFQFRYWPNNNSRMYVLEGVTPCIQSMQLQAGDTVTFSRIDPGGKLVMGYRKATNSVPLQESQISAFASGAISNETFFSGVIENLPITDKHGSKLNNGNASQSLLALERRRSRNIGSKSKRLLMDNEDALDLKLTWEEAQDLLRPPPSVEPSIVMIEDHEFEEYEDPPVFGKRTIFTARSSGEQDQWVQCDSCFKWRRLPTDVLLPSKWTCSDNTWDLKRSSCIMPDELSPNELLILLQQNSDNKRQKIGGCAKQSLLEQVASSLDSMPTAVAVADDRNQVIPSVATTTRHPRHRPGCTCIVCIQPPSGKGQKHKPACVCNVCLTVKRRFTTLMMRKKKRQSEQEETESQKKLLCDNKEGIEADSSLKRVQPIDTIHESEFENRCGKILIEKLDTNKGQIDLNYRPGREEQKQAGLARVSMMSLLQEANRPLETYLKQNGLTSLANEQRVGSTIEALPQAVGESEGRAPEVSHIASAVQELGDTGGDEGHCKAGNIESNAV